MNTVPKARKPIITGAAVVAALAVALSGCAHDTGATKLPPGTSDSIVVGTTEAMTSLDPAGSRDTPSQRVQAQVFSHLVEAQPGKDSLTLELAEAAKFTPEGNYSVTLKKGLVFSNGDDLTTSDVAFSFARQRAINDPAGPNALLAGLGSVEVVDATTVVFHLGLANDQSFPAVLASQAGYIVDEEAFSATALTPAADVVAADAFSGQYRITAYDENRLVSFETNDHYQGALGTPIAQQVDLQYFRAETDLVPKIRDGSIDIAYGGLSVADQATTKTDKKVRLVVAPSGEVRSLAFNLLTMPFGAGTAEADPAKALAVRVAIADLVDRAALAKLYGSAYAPSYSVVPSSVSGWADSLSTKYGDKNGSPDPDAARQALSAAQITGTVTIALHFSADHFGELSTQEFALLTSQLEAGGLFTVTAKSTDWALYQGEQASDQYPAFLTAWRALYPDAGGYVAPQFSAGVIPGNHYGNAELATLVASARVELDPAKRATDFGDIQSILADDLPVIPLLQSQRFVATSAAVTGTHLDSSATIRFGTLVKRA